MQHYRYKAVTDAGQYIRGRMSANNVAELTGNLRADGLELLSYTQERENTLVIFNQIKPKDLISLFVQLEQLDKAGVPIVDAIFDVIEAADSFKIKNVMREVAEDIRNGSLFSESLAKHPKVFEPVYVGLIGMGEKTGKLSVAFNSIIEDIKWNMDIKRKARKATMGPAFGIFLMLVVVGVMTSVVVPKVTGFLSTQGINLPGATVALMAFSSFVINYWYIIIFGVPIAVIATKIAAKNSTEFAFQLDTFKLRIPIIGPIINKIEAAKFCQFFSITFKSGLGVLECLESASSVVKNHAIKRSISIIKRQVSDGMSLAKAINMTDQFPNLVVRMFKVGEESGNMEGALLNIKYFYDREINDSIERLVGMIQPSITMVMGGMIAWITIAVFGPIYGTFSAIK
jgi:type IV pilus assembly protein PilC